MLSSIHVPIEDSTVLNSDNLNQALKKNCFTALYPRYEKTVQQRVGE